MWGEWIGAEDAQKQGRVFLEVIAMAERRTLSGSGRGRKESREI